MAFAERPQQQFIAGAEIQPLRGSILYVVSEDWAFLSHRLPMASAAREAGFSVHVATRIGEDAEAIRAHGFTLHPIPFVRGRLSPLAALSTILALRRVGKAVGPTLVHHVGLQCCVLGGLASLGANRPQVNALTGLGYTFTGGQSRSGFFRRAMTATLKFLLNRQHAVTLVQNPDDQAALEQIGISGGHLALIPGSGVDTDALQPLPEPEGPITVGFAGRLLTDKGIRALLSAHRLLRQRGLDIHLHIAGEPDPANPASVSLQEAQAWNREPGITWLGHVDDIASLWQRSHIAALPSHREGLPKSLLEAAAFGRPMVSTDAPGCREIVIHDRTGLLVPIEDPSALADAIATLAESPELRARYGAAARELVAEKMSARAIGQTTLELYRSMIAR
ncbi:glycosyltransferase family 4 protein [Bradyrhizobium prioriisuperbiae]|uniref:glycosyltransferase family 4 protein n=1 Tax=Bradyrhizobium prioriisuperbiae TaxID=2854389 RepID=UPI0028E6533C|nr:glycosyltransferase family 4 protein [Bradyrhizobium prioritasuperba]